MKNIFRFTILLFALLALQACSENSPLDSKDENVIYFNSFEADKDIEGWSGLTKEMFSDTGCTSESKKSMHIGGGCIQPAASYELSAAKTGNYKISFWAKMGQVSQSANIVLKISGENDESKKINVVVSGTEWKQYSSNGSLYLPVNKKLTLEIWVGGIIFADVYIDNLKIEKIPS